MNTATPNLADLLADLPSQSSINPVITDIPNLADLPLMHASSGQECQCQISIVKSHIHWQIYPPVEASSGKEWQFQCSIVRVYISRSTGRSTPLVVQCIL